MIDYQKGKIYKIVNSENDKLYIGSTCRELSTRMAGHRSKAKLDPAPFHKAMIAIGIHKFKIILIKPFPCNNKAELLSEEYRITNEFAQTFELYNSDMNGKKSHLSKKLTSAGHFKRGYIERSNTRDWARWRFEWYAYYDNARKKLSKSFSVLKYGEEKAKQMAEAMRDAIYPIFSKDFVDRRVELKMEELRASHESLADRGKVEVAAYNDLVKFYNYSVQAFQKHLKQAEINKEAIDAPEVVRMRKLLAKALYAQTVAENCRVTVVFDPER